MWRNYREYWLLDPPISGRQPIPGEHLRLQQQVMRRCGDPGMCLSERIINGYFTDISCWFPLVFMKSQVKDPDSHLKIASVIWSRQHALSSSASLFMKTHFWLYLMRNCKLELILRSVFHQEYVAFTTVRRAAKKRLVRVGKFLKFKNTVL